MLTEVLTHIRRYGRFVLLLLVSASACTNSSLAPNGSCKVDKDRSLHCGSASDGAATDTRSYISYSCTGNARPDQDATYIDGVPQGIVCADTAKIDDESVQGYCCTAKTTDCAYNPVASCDDTVNYYKYGFQCRGANRPEMVNPALDCGNGVRQDDLIDYCCTGSHQPKPIPCISKDITDCVDRFSKRVTGWNCPLGEQVPRSEDLANNKSRADIYYPICAMPSPATDGKTNNFCCFVSAVRKPGSTCDRYMSVPGCAPFRFGFACYGPDTPEDDFLPIHCPDPGFAGQGLQGPATLYCCDLRD